MRDPLRFLLRLGLAVTLTLVASTASAQILPLAEACNATTLDVSPLPDGGAVVTWEDDGVHARLLAPDGQPRTPILDVAPDVDARIVRGFAADENHVVFVWTEDLAGRLRFRILQLTDLRFEDPFDIDSSTFHMDADGGGGHFAVVWNPSGPVTTQARMWDVRTRQPLDLAIEKPPGPGAGGIGTGQPEVAVDSTGTVWVSTTFIEDALLRIHNNYGITLQWFDSQGRRQIDPTLALQVGIEPIDQHDLVVAPTGELVFTWRKPGSGTRMLFYARIDPPSDFIALDGIRLDDGIGTPRRFSPHVAVSPGGQDFVAWIEETADDRAQVVGRHVIPAGVVGPEIVFSVPAEVPLESSVTPLGNGLLTAWAATAAFPAPPNPACTPHDRIAGVVVTPSAHELLLQDHRFRVSVEWEDPRSGDTGVGTAVPLTDDTGAFWFFDEENLELMVKVLDARPVNGHFWVFFGSLTDVEFELTVTDLATGAERTYTNPPFEMASRADTTAFDGAP